ncbi:MAG: hypothetical protein DPW14_17695 [Planctomycetes bacterium]|nr:hypothetical protein [Planctomycetota bacterium]
MGGAALSGEVSGVWLDGAQIFNGVGLWTQSPPRALFTTQNADPTGLTQINGVVLLDFFAYIKSFLRTVDDSDLTMGSGTFGGIGSGNGVTPPGHAAHHTVHTRRPCCVQRLRAGPGWFGQHYGRAGHGRAGGLHAPDDVAALPQ